MKILKTAYISDAVPGHPLECDTIEFEGRFWLVPLWTENHATGKMRPERIICLDCLPHQTFPQVAKETFVLNIPIPKCVLDGEIPYESAYNFEIVENPEIDFDIPEKLH